MVTPTRRSMLFAGGGALTALTGCVPSTARGRAQRAREATEPRTLRAEGASDSAFDRDATVALVAERLEARIETAVVEGSAPIDLDESGPNEPSVARPAAVEYGGRCYSLETGRTAGDGGSACELRARRRAPPDGGGVHALSIPPLTADGRELVRRAAEEGPVAPDEPHAVAVSALLERYDYVALESGHYALRY